MSQERTQNENDWAAPFSSRDSVSESEKSLFIRIINKDLINDKDLSKILPIDIESNASLTEAVKPGVLLCKLINKWIPQSISEAEIKLNAHNKFDMIENHNKLLFTAKKMGCKIGDIQGSDLVDPPLPSILTIMWQIFQIGICNRFPETIERLKLPSIYQSMKTHEKVLNWMTSILQKQGSQRLIRNFTTDIRDSEVYIRVLHHLQPNNCKLQLLEENDTSRAIKVLQAAEAMNLPLFVSSHSILEGNQKLNFLFSASIFNLAYSFPLSDYDSTRQSLSNTNIDTSNINSNNSSIGVNKSTINEHSLKADSSIVNNNNNNIIIVVRDTTHGFVNVNNDNESQNQNPREGRVRMRTRSFEKLHSITKSPYLTSDSSSLTNTSSSSQSPSTNNYTKQPINFSHHHHHHQQHHHHHQSNNTRDEKNRNTNHNQLEVNHAGNNIKRVTLQNDSEIKKILEVTGDHPSRPTSHSSSSPPHPTSSSSKKRKTKSPSHSPQTTITTTSGTTTADRSDDQQREREREERHVFLKEMEERTQKLKELANQLQMQERDLKVKASALNDQEREISLKMEEMQRREKDQKLKEEEHERSCLLLRSQLQSKEREIERREREAREVESALQVRSNELQQKEVMIADRERVANELLESFEIDDLENIIRALQTQNERMKEEHQRMSDMIMKYEEQQSTIQYLQRENLILRDERNRQDLRIRSFKTRLAEEFNKTQHSKKLLANALDTMAFIEMKNLELKKKTELQEIIIKSSITDIIGDDKKVKDLSRVTSFRHKRDASPRDSSREVKESPRNSPRGSPRVARFNSQIFRDSSVDHSPRRTSDDHHNSDPGISHCNNIISSHSSGSSSNYYYNNNNNNNNQTNNNESNSNSNSGNNNNNGGGVERKAEKSSSAPTNEGSSILGEGKKFKGKLLSTSTPKSRRYTESASDDPNDNNSSPSGKLKYFTLRRSTPKKDRPEPRSKEY